MSIGMKEYQRLYREQNKGIMQEKSKLEYIKNIDKHKRYQKEYREKYKEELRRSARVYMKKIRYLDWRVVYKAKKEGLNKQDLIYIIKSNTVACIRKQLFI